MAHDDFEKQMQIESGTLQKKAVEAILTMADSGQPLGEYKEWLLNQQGTDANNLQALADLEASLIDKFAMALSMENPYIPRILRFMQDNEQAIFPEGFHSYDFHVRVEEYVEMSRSKVLRCKFKNEDGSARDLPAMTHYLKVRWDEEISWLVASGDVSVVKALAEHGLFNESEFAYQFLGLSGYELKAMRIAALGTEKIGLPEANFRLKQIMAHAFPILANTLHMMGSPSQSRRLVTDFHLPALEGAEPFIREWGLFEVRRLIEQAKRSHDLNPGSIVPRNAGQATGTVFSYLKQHIPDLYRHLGNLMCGESLATVADPAYTEAEFATGLMKKIISMGLRNSNNTFNTTTGRGLYPCYVEILKVWGEDCLKELPDHLDQDEMLLAYELLGYQPLLKHLTGRHRDIAFSGDLGI